MPDTRRAIDALGALLAERGYVAETPRAGAELFATRRGRGLGPCFPYIDYVFVHELDGADADRLERRHGEARDYAESQFRLPRALRYRIPNVVTIAVSSGPPEPGAIEWAGRGRRRPVSGGVTESAYLVDLAAGRIVSAGLQGTPMRYGGTTTTSVNPTNRFWRMMAGLAPLLGLRLEDAGA